jgi:hypothetical protein
MPLKRTTSKGRIEKTVNCGYCGQKVDQSHNKHKRHLKWFHNNCINDHKNLKTSIMKRENISDVKISWFRDQILFQMIMRKDLRLMHQQWILLIKNKADPIELQQIFVEA